MNVFFGNARQFRGAFLGQFFAFPRGDEIVGFADEKQLGMLVLLKGVWVKNKDRFLLINAREVKQVAVLAERKRAVRIGRQNVVGRDCRPGVGLESGRQTTAVFNKQGSRWWRVFHLGKWNRKKAEPSR